MHPALRGQSLNMNVFSGTLSLIIPVHNGGRAFRSCLDAVAVLSPPPTEVLVVANGDHDGSGQFAEERECRVLNIPEAVGPAQARNVGVQQARGDIIFFVDADITVRRDAIARVNDFFQKHPECSALFGSYDDEPYEQNFLSQYKNLMHHYVHQHGKEDASTFWAGCGAIRREVFLEVGGFDEKKFRKPCIEDIDLGYRLKKAGYRICLLKDLQCKHLKRWTPCSLLKADIFYRALPWTELLAQNKQFMNDLNVDTSGRTSVALIGLLFLSPLLGILWPLAFWLALCWAAGLLWLNRDVYRFFRQKRGLKFTLMAIPWHWLYFFYSGVAFVLGTLRFYIRSQR